MLGKKEPHRAWGGRGSFPGYAGDETFFFRHIYISLERNYYIYCQAKIKKKEMKILK